MVKTKNGHLLGAWAFLIGVILAVILGLFKSSIGNSQTILVILVVLGLIVGLLNVWGRDMNTFLLAGTVLVLVSFLGQNALSIISYVGDVLNALLVLFVPATVVVAVKAVFAVARD